MNPIFLQYELRYTPILDFRSIYKGLVDNYLKFEDIKFDIQSYGNLDEHIILNFNNYHIDFRMDRLIIRFEGEISNVQRSSGATFFFFKILDSLHLEHKNLDIKLALLKIIAIKIIPEFDLGKSLDSFKESYLSDSSQSILKDPSDFAVVLENDIGGISFNLQFGPFKPSDINKNTLSPLQTPYIKSLVDSNSYGMQATLLRRQALTKTSYTSFKKSLEESLIIINKI